MLVSTDEPLDRLRVGSRESESEPEPESLRVLVGPGVFYYEYSLVDQTLVFGREEKRDGDENQSQEEILRSGYLLVSQVEHVVEEGGHREEREERERGYDYKRVRQTGRPGSWT